MTNTKPLIFLDIDGVLNRNYSRKRAKKEGSRESFHPDPRGIRRWRMFTNPADYENLLKPLEEYGELAWGTTWEDVANESVRHSVGIPYEFPVVARTLSSDPEVAGKAAGILRASEGRPFVWFDDDFDAGMINWLNRKAEQDFFLVPVADIRLEMDDEGETGLTEAHIKTAISFLKTL